MEADDVKVKVKDRMLMADVSACNVNDSMMESAFVTMALKCFHCKIANYLQQCNFMKQIEFSF